MNDIDNVVGTIKMRKGIQKRLLTYGNDGESRADIVIKLMDFKDEIENLRTNPFYESEFRKARRSGTHGRR